MATGARWVAASTAVGGACCGRAVVTSTVTATSTVANAVAAPVNSGRVRARTRRVRTGCSIAWNTTAEIAKVMARRTTDSGTPRNAVVSSLSSRNRFTVTSSGDPTSLKWCFTFSISMGYFFSLQTMTASRPAWPSPFHQSLNDLPPDPTAVKSTAAMGRA